MATFLRLRASHTLIETARKLLPSSGGVGKLIPEATSKLAWCVRIAGVNKKVSVDKLRLTVSWRLLEACDLLPRSLSKDEKISWGHAVADKLQGQGDIGDPVVTESGLFLHVDFALASQLVLREIVSQREKYGFDSALHRFRRTPDGVVCHETPENIVVEYSSPNIAKQFHAGHLRSTVIGNFIANLCSALGDRVTRLNYLGDWGTQFGLLGVGFAKYGSEEKLQSNPVQHLFDVYVAINKDLEAENKDEATSSSTIYKDAMEFFRRMESGDTEAMKFWRTCRAHSIEEYVAMYQRLDVHFDEFHGEEMYHERSLELVEQIKKMGLVKVDGTSGVGYIDLCEPGSSETFHANLVKSNGSTLYITRDIAAAMDRYERYKFDKMFYVVENGQHAHFRQLVCSLRAVGAAGCAERISHVKFGRVAGMSSRRGEVVLLRDILDEARDRMAAVMTTTQTTKTRSDAELARVAERLGASALVVYDLRTPRLQNYHFDWQRVLNFHGETGVFLQYTHARLHSLERNCGIPVDPDCRLDRLTEPEALRIVQTLARFDEVIQLCRFDLQSSYLLQYLFTLCRLLGNAIKVLQVKGQDDDIAKARLLLFHCSRLTLSNGLVLLGVDPLDRM